MAADSKVIELATARKPAPDLPELGAPGTNFSKGFLRGEEYVPELVGRAGLDVFEKMRRSDATVAGTLRAIKLPILGAEWDIEPGSEGATASGAQIRDRLRDNLFNRMSMPWKEHIRQTLTHLDFGFYVCELVWEATADGFFHIRKFAPRLQRTIIRWNQADDGGLESITQQAFSGKPTTVDIPIDKLVVFTNQKEGANWMGVSALRPAYKHWFYKELGYRIQAMGIERHGVGIPVMHLPPDKDDDTTMSRAEDILVGVRSHERGYVVEPDGYTFRIEGMGQGRAMDAQPMIDHHDSHIPLAMLAQFLLTALTTGGSNAMSEDHSSFFMLAERAVADYVADIHNRYVIPQWVKFNYGEVAKLPQLKVTRIETRDLEKFVNALATAAGQKLVTPDEGLEAAIRDLGGLPPLDKATARQVAPAPAPQPQPAGQKPGTEPPPAPAPAPAPEGDPNA